jgi:heterodisulfide reductase subunit A
LLTLCRLREISGKGGDFRVRAVQEPRFVKVDDCIGCLKCEQACPVMVPSEEQGGFAARKAIYLPLSNAAPPAPRLAVEDCTLCGKCAKVCPTGAVDYFEQPRELEIRAGAVVVCTGYSLFREFPERAWGEHASQPNLIDALQMERILAPTGPYPRLLRPSDGKEPESVAFIQCAGSRDVQLGVPYCSRVCCMYNIKQAALIARELPATKVTIYCMDVRCFGKGYEQFYSNAKRMGIEFVKAKGVIIGRDEDDGVILRHEDIEGTGDPLVRRHDLAVLSLAVVPAWRPDGCLAVEAADDGFIASSQPVMASVMTSAEGVFMAGMAAGPKDIVDTVVEAGAAAGQAAVYLRELGARDRRAA